MEDWIVEERPCGASEDLVGKVATAANIHHRTRRAAVVIADPRITVVESTETADRAALDDALELLVKWAVRARMRRESASVEASSDKDGASYGAED